MAVSWLKKGKDVQEAVAQADAEAELKKSQTFVNRFWMPEDAEKQITFLDGDLSDDGTLDTVAIWEHQLKLNGHWRNWFTCTQDEEPCPICVDDNPALVAFFTVLDHSSWTDKKGVEHKNQRKLYPAKRETLKRLQKMAEKRGGLTGITFDVSRIGDKSASVGTDFDFMSKRAPSELMEAYGLSEEDVTPFNYEEVLTYHTADELRKLGFGSAAVGSADTKAVAANANYDKDL